MGPDGQINQGARFSVVETKGVDIRFIAALASGRGTLYAISSGNSREGVPGSLGTIAVPTYRDTPVPTSGLTPGVPRGDRHARRQRPRPAPPRPASGDTPDQVNRVSPTCDPDFVELVVDETGTAVAATLNGQPVSSGGLPSVSTGGTFGPDGLFTTGARFPSILEDNRSNVTQVPFEVCACLEPLVLEPRLPFDCSAIVLGDENAGCGNTLLVGPFAPGNIGFVSGEVREPRRGRWSRAPSPR